MTTSQYLLQRLAQVPFVLVVITVVVFTLMRVTPGDPAVIMLGVYASPETIQAVRREFNLDRPAVVQYFLWVGRLVRGDLGQSIRTRERINEMIASRLPTSVTLALAATLLSVVISIPAGILAAYRHNSVLDYGSMILAMAGLSIPNFALALLLIFVFSVRLGWFPITGVGMVPFREAPWQAVGPYVLPTVALGVFHTAELARLLRSSLLDVLHQDYIRVALAKGLAPRVMLIRHALKNAIIPIVTVVAINFAFTVGATITIEYIFAIPGMGTQLIQAVIHRDLPVIQGFTLVTGLLFIFMNILADLIYLLVDPRIKYA